MTHPLVRLFLGLALTVSVDVCPARAPATTAMTKATTRP